MPPTTSVPKKTILIIEDDQFLLKAYKIRFELDKVEVWTAFDGDQANEYLAKEPPSVILLDLMLPKISGFEVLEKIRSTERWKNVPVFIMSNLSQPEDIARGKKLGVIEYFVKANTRLNEIVEKVNQYSKWQ